MLPWLCSICHRLRLTDARWLGQHDWYREGAAHLVTWRKDATAWNNNVLDTCFALLFLKRATHPLDTTGSD